MCGIAGTTNASAFDVAAMLERIRHRGPDGDGVLNIDREAHGHVRLAIIDPAERSNQPFQYRDVVLCYNGELWNTDALRDELIGKGHRFSTDGDTEVLAAMLSEYGMSCLDRLDGMFCFSVRLRGRTYLVRDRIGKLPLYAIRTKAGWAWASERKAFGRRVGGLVSPVPAGHYLSLPESSPVSFYSVHKCVREPLDGAATVERLLVQGVEKRLTSDVPVCVLVSGGLDSSLVAAIAARKRPDIVGFVSFVTPDSPDLLAARAVAKHVNIRLVEVQVPPVSEQALRRSVEVVETSTKSSLETGAIAIPFAAAVSKHGYKVALSGEMADEVFGGYGPLRRHATSDTCWSNARRTYVDRMSRGDFMRANKTFMASSVELRMPFCERELYERALSSGVAACPPDKRLVRLVAAKYLPKCLATRPKNSWHKAAGIRAACDAKYPSPVRFYNSLVRSHWGRMVRG